MSQGALGGAFSHAFFSVDKKHKKNKDNTIIRDKQDDKYNLNADKSLK